MSYVPRMRMPMSYVNTGESTYRASKLKKHGQHHQNHRQIEPTEIHTDVDKDEIHVTQEVTVY